MSEPRAEQPQAQASLSDDGRPERLSSMAEDDGTHVSGLTQNTAGYQVDDYEEEEEEGSSSSSSSSDASGDGDDTASQQQAPPPSPPSSSAAAAAPQYGQTHQHQQAKPPHAHAHAPAPAHEPPRTPPPPPTYGSFCHAVLLGCLTISMSFSINILNLIVYLTVRPWSRVTARRITGEWFQCMWANVMAYLLPRSELVFTGDTLVDPTRPAIIIANHQVDADWWYCWEFARAFGLHGRLKIILKADLRNIPVVGWGMRQFEFLFLDRNWQADKRKLYRLLGSFVEDGYECCLLIFPEGTTANTRTFEKSRAFAADHDRPHLDHLLLPRITGFAACLDALSQTGQVPVVYDLTLAYHGYSGEIPTWEMGYGRSRDVDVPNVEGMLRGRACPRVHVHVAAHDGDEAVLNDAQAWLDARWREKDVLLQRFIEKGGFAPPGEQRVLRPQGSLASLLFLLVLPLLIALLLPAILLLTLVAWPVILLAGTVTFLKSVGKTISSGDADADAASSTRRRRSHGHHGHHGPSSGSGSGGKPHRVSGHHRHGGHGHAGGGGGGEADGGVPPMPPRGSDHSYSRFYKEVIWGSGINTREEFRQRQQQDGKKFE